MSHTTEVMPISVRFLPILARINWLPWQRPLGPYNQKCLVWIYQPQNSLKSNHVFFVSRKNAFVAILVPKSLFPLCTEVSQMNSVIAETLPHKKLIRR